MILFHSDNGGPIDMTDPCARAAALSSAYNAALAGSLEIEIRARSFDADELVRFLPVDIEKLRIEMQSAQSECAKAREHRDARKRRRRRGAARRSRRPTT